METVRPTTFRSCFIPWSIDSDVLAAPKSVREACDDTWRGQSFVLILLNRNHSQHLIYIYTYIHIRWCCECLHSFWSWDPIYKSIFPPRCALDFFPSIFFSSISSIIRSWLFGKWKCNADKIYNIYCEKYSDFFY